MKCLSIRQPWAWAILAGHKPVENRTWATRYRGPLAVHAALRYDYAGEKWMLDTLDIHPPADLPRGGIIGRVMLRDCITHHESRWFVGPFGFLLEEPVPIPVIPWRGQLGLFCVPDELVER